MKTSCKDIKELLPVYVDNMTNQIESAIVEEHLAECAECRREYEFLKSIIDTATTLPGIEISENFNDTLHQKLLEAKAAKRSKTLASFRKAAVAVLSSAAVIAISVVSLNVLDEKDMTDVVPQKTTKNIYRNADGAVTESASDEGGILNDALSESDSLQSEESAEASAQPEDRADSIQESAPEAAEAAQTEKAAETQRATASESPNVSGGAGKKKQADESTAIPAESSTGERRASSSRASSGGGSTVYDLSPSSALPETPAYDGSGGGLSAYTGSKKTKITASITVSDENRASVDAILSGYTYSNGAYELSASEYSKVFSQLDQLKIYPQLTKEDKTADYASLTAQLENASGSKAQAIQSQLNEIDNEVSKTYVIVN